MQNLSTKWDEIQEIMEGYPYMFPERAIKLGSRDYVAADTSIDILERNDDSIRQVGQRFVEEVEAGGMFGAIQNRKKKRQVKVVRMIYPQSNAEILDFSDPNTDAGIGCAITGLNKAEQEGMYYSIDKYVKGDGFQISYKDWSKKDNWDSFVTQFQNLLFQEVAALEKKIAKYVLDKAFSFAEKNLFTGSEVIRPSGVTNYIDPKNFDENLLVEMQPVIAMNGMEQAKLYDGFCTGVAKIKAQMESVDTDKASRSVKWGAIEMMQDFHQMMKGHPNKMLLVNPNALFLGTYTDYNEQEQVTPTLITTTIPANRFGENGPSNMNIRYDLVVNVKCDDSGREPGIFSSIHCLAGVWLEVFPNANARHDGTPDILVFEKGCMPDLDPCDLTAKKCSDVVYTIGAMDVTTDKAIIMPANPIAAAISDGNGGTTALTISGLKATLHRQDARNAAYTDPATGDVVDFDATEMASSVTISDLPTGVWYVKFTGTTQITIGGESHDCTISESKRVVVKCDACQ